MKCTDALLAIAAVIASASARDLDMKLQWYHDGACTDFKGEYDYWDGGLFGIGATAEGCKQITLGTNTGSANLIGGDVAADCQLYTGYNCDGQKLASLHEGTTGTFGNSPCLFLAAPVNSFECERGGVPIKA